MTPASPVVALLRPCLRAAVIALLLASPASTLPGRAAVDDREADDARRLVKALALAPGMTVAEIGAGDGALALGVARELGDGGRLFASELGSGPLVKLRDAVERAKSSVVTVIEADAERTGLPDACCDAIYMRDVYHHFGNVATMTASLRQSLKPCGRLGVIDFTPPPGQEDAKPVGRGGSTHGMPLRTLSDELAAAGFEILSEETLARRNYMVLARRPGTDASPARTCDGPAPKKS